MRNDHRYRPTLDQLHRHLPRRQRLRKLGHRLRTIHSDSIWADRLRRITPVPAPTRGHLRPRMDEPEPSPPRCDGARMTDVPHLVIPAAHFAPLAHGYGDAAAMR